MRLDASLVTATDSSPVIFNVEATPPGTQNQTVTVLTVQSATTTTGAFTIPGLLPGIYRISASLKDRTKSICRFGGPDGGIVVSQSDVTGIHLVLGGCN